MTGNITVHNADWATVCGSIEFSTNFTRKRYKLTVALGEGLVLEDLDSTDKKRVQVTCDEVLVILRQGDERMWTWHSFLQMWGGWVAGYHAGRSYERAYRLMCWFVYWMAECE